MVGYIVVNRDEMKVKDYETYHAFYCGLCKQLKERYGISGQFSLTYDMTFLAILLTGLYEPETMQTQRACAVHPMTKHRVCSNEFVAYAADMNVLLSYYKCEDDWKDERRLGKGAYAQLLRRKLKKKEDVFGSKAEKIGSLLEELTECERQQRSDIDYLAGLYGAILAEVFACREDVWEDSLRKIGCYLGKFVYLMDAYEDVERDIRKKNFNPLKERFAQESFEADCEEILTMFISACCREFEKLPILEYAEILRNILYSGVWYRYELVKEKRRREPGRKKQDESNERSI